MYVETLRWCRKCRKETVHRRYQRKKVTTHSGTTTVKCVECNRRNAAKWHEANRNLSRKRNREWYARNRDKKRRQDNAENMELRYVLARLEAGTLVAPGQT